MPDYKSVDGNLVEVPNPEVVKQQEAKEVSDKALYEELKKKYEPVKAKKVNKEEK